MNVIVEFSGGLEALFGGQRKRALTLDEGTTIKQLLGILKHQMTDSRTDLFLQDDLV